MLTDRLATALVDHEPGWRLPRRSDLARRFGATADELEAALASLARLGMIRVMADGQVYRASPAEALITLDGLPCLGSRIDAMGTVLTRASWQVLRREVPQEITSALRLPPRSGACAIQSTWATDGTVTAVSTTYLPASLAGALIPKGDGTELGAALNPVPPHPNPALPAASPAALNMEVQPPTAWAARILRLRPTEPAITVTVRFDYPAGTPLAVTVAVLHAARFRIAVETPGNSLAGAQRAVGAAEGEHPQQEDVNGVRLDPDGWRAFVDGTEVVLARTEYDLLRALLDNAGMVLSRRELLHIVRLPGHANHIETLEAHIRRLRRKLDPGSPAPRIRTVRGVGYTFDIAPASGLRATARSSHRILPGLPGAPGTSE